jgi:hypothetical protein
MALAKILLGAVFPIVLMGSGCDENYSNGRCYQEPRNGIYIQVQKPRMERGYVRRQRIHEKIRIERAKYEFRQKNIFRHRKH